jgi:hypothetical protein
MSKQPISPLESIQIDDDETRRRPAQTPSRVTVAAPVPESDEDEPFVPRKGITIRLTLPDFERLRVLAFRRNKQKQFLLDQAIREYLDRHNV